MINNFFSIRVLKKIGLLKYFNAVIPRVINRLKVKIPIKSGQGWTNLYPAELWMCSLLAKLLPLKQGVFIDVGVNVGQTLLKLRSVNKDIGYIGFEPNSSCVAYTRELIKINEFNNSRLIPVGLYNNDSILELNLYYDNDVDDSASLHQEFRPGQEVDHKIYVPVKRFEEVNKILHLESIAIIKIDVEGAELEVLQGLKNTINDFRPIIMMEILPCYTADNKYRIERQMQIEGLFSSLDYTIFRIISDKSATTKLQPITTIEIHGSMELTNYIVVHTELVPKIIALQF